MSGFLQPSSGAGTVPNFASGETPTGTIDSMNVTFFLTHGPNPAGSLQLFLNGQLQTVGTDFTLSGAGGNVITFASAPMTGDTLLAYYMY